ncbi:MAG: glycosyltransferase family 25 protein [Parabacteroides gordonii]|uniref:glycosyltransferase family 25 protein n=1 Tax=Parabacteroides gordonii TaxID=574930 RepID=UPI003A8C85CC
MKTYIINLEKSLDRKRYVENILSNYPFLDIEFIVAVDANKMSNEEQNKLFNVTGFSKKYSKKVRPGEIGCTLSHQKCYRKLLNSNEDYVLILEDDIILNNEFQETLEKLKNHIDPIKPQVILLSGWYWFYKSTRLNKKYKLADVLDAFLTHAYIINKTAAKLLVEPYPFTMADDWKYIRQKGITLNAILPHLVDQVWNGEFNSMVNIGNSSRIKGNYFRKSKILFHSIYLKFIALLGGFENASFKK